jgi:hypothetical protein
MFKHPAEEMLPGGWQWTIHGTCTHASNDSKPGHSGIENAARDGGTESVTAVGSNDFHEKAVECEFSGT